MKISTAKIVTSLSLAAYGLVALPATVMAEPPGQMFPPAVAQEGEGINIGTIEAGSGFASDIGSIITTLLSAVMGIAALLLFFYLIWGGISWLTSGGEKGKTEEARNKITAAVIGLVILAASYAILMLILRILGFESLSSALGGIEPFTTKTGEL